MCFHLRSDEKKYENWENRLIIIYFYYFYFMTFRVIFYNCSNKTCINIKGPIKKFRDEDVSKDERQLKHKNNLQNSRKYAKASFKLERREDWVIDGLSRICDFNFFLSEFCVNDWRQTFGPRLTFSLLCKLHKIRSVDSQENHSSCCHQMSHFIGCNAPNSISAGALLQTALGSC